MALNLCSSRKGVKRDPSRAHHGQYSSVHSAAVGESASVIGLTDLGQSAGLIDHAEKPYGPTVDDYIEALPDSRPEAQYASRIRPP